MSNVVSFPVSSSAASSSAVSSSPGDFNAAGIAVADLGGRMAEILRLQSRVRNDVRGVILMADLAVMRGRIFADGILDPAAQNAFRAHLSEVERLVDIARVKASAL